MTLNEYLREYSRRYEERADEIEYAEKLYWEWRVDWEDEEEDDEPRRTLEIILSSVRNGEAEVQDMIEYLAENGWYDESR